MFEFILLTQPIDNWLFHTILHWTKLFIFTLDESWKLCSFREGTSCDSSWRQRFDEWWPSAADKQRQELSADCSHRGLCFVPNYPGILQIYHPSKAKQIWNFTQIVSSFSKKIIKLQSLVFYVKKPIKWTNFGLIHKSKLDFTINVRIENMFETDFLF